MGGELKVLDFFLFLSVFNSTYSPLYYGHGKKKKKNIYFTSLFGIISSIKESSLWCPFPNAYALWVSFLLYIEFLENIRFQTTVLHTGFDRAHFPRKPSSLTGFCRETEWVLDHSNKVDLRILTAWSPLSIAMPLPSVG